MYWKLHVVQLISFPFISNICCASNRNGVFNLQKNLEDTYNQRFKDVNYDWSSRYQIILHCLLSLSRWKVRNFHFLFIVVRYSLSSLFVDKDNVCVSMLLSPSQWSYVQCSRVGCDFWLVSLKRIICVLLVCLFIDHVLSDQLTHWLQFSFFT